MSRGKDKELVDKGVGLEEAAIMYKDILTVTNSTLFPKIIVCTSAKGKRQGLRKVLKPGPSKKNDAISSYLCSLGTASVSIYRMLKVSKVVVVPMWVSSCIHGISNNIGFLEL